MCAERYDKMVKRQWLGGTKKMHVTLEEFEDKIGTKNEQWAREKLKISWIRAYKMLIHWKSAHKYTIYVNIPSLVTGSPGLSDFKLPLHTHMQPLCYETDLEIEAQALNVRVP